MELTVDVEIHQLVLQPNNAATRVKEYVHHLEQLVLELTKELFANVEVNQLAWQTNNAVTRQEQGHVNL